MLLQIEPAVRRVTQIAALATCVALLAPAAGVAGAEDAVGAPPAREATEPEQEDEGEAQDADGGDPTDATPGPPAEEKRRRPREVFETTNLEDPAFPTSRPALRIRDAFRIRIQSRFLPSGAFESFDADLIRPDVRLRVTAPLSKRAVLQLTARWGMSLYDFDEGGALLGTGVLDSSSEFQQASLGLQGGLRLNDGRSFFAEGEIWSLLLAGRAQSRWEPGRFVDALTANGALALGYEIDDLIRIGVGVQLGSRIDRGGVRVTPVFNLKWEPTERFTVRNRGTGLQLEYRMNKRLEFFATGFLDSDKFLLDNRPGQPDDITFRDRSILAGLGFEWKISKHFRVNVEGGAVAWREVRVRSRDRGTIFDEEADPGAYFDLRFEVRP